MFTFGCVFDRPKGGGSQDKMTNRRMALGVRLTGESEGREMEVNNRRTVKAKGREGRNSMFLTEIRRLLPLRTLCPCVRPIL
jgi:hypothetical protein